MLKTLPKFTRSLLFATMFCATAFGDTVVLTSGEKLEGKILKETDTEVTIETRAGGIVDERTIKRSEISSVGKASPDEAPWQALRGLKLGNNSMQVEQYDQYLGSLKAFLTQYPESKYKPEAEKLVAEFEAEKQRVAKGERKLSGNWISKEEVQRESYQINGAVALNYMRDQATHNDVVGALNTFDLLEKQYPGSRSYIDAVDLAQRLLPPLRQQAEARLARLPAEMAERQKAVQLARAADKAQVQADMEREKLNNATALAQAKQQNRKWPPLLPTSEESLQQIVQLAKDETSRLAAVDLAKPRESVRLAEQVKAAIAKKDIPTAEETLKKAQEAWSQNEMLTRLDADLAKARDTAAAEPTAATAEKSADSSVGDKTAAEGSTGSGDTSTKAGTDDSDTPNPFFRVVIGAVIVVFLYAAWKAYSSIRKKANEVIE
jgi:hypothetical protein